MGDGRYRRLDERADPRRASRLNADGTLTATAVGAADLRARPASLDVVMTLGMAYMFAAMQLLM